MENQVKLINKIGKEIKYSVVFTDIMLTIYVLWLILTDTAHWLPGALLGYTPIGLQLLLKSNKIFHLCIVHRAMLIHSFLVYCCCVYQAYYGFGAILYPIRWVMFISDLCLIIQLIIKQCK